MHCTRLNVPGLIDAPLAQSAHSMECSLILTEGRGGEAFVLSGLTDIQRPYYGIYQLKGKIMNVQKASAKQALANVIINNNLCQAIGLKRRTKYNTMQDLRKLRYGKLKILCDQDGDGGHIKGLIINVLKEYWPELLKLPFLEILVTPVLKLLKKGVENPQKDVDELSFYSIAQFREWKKTTSNYSIYDIRYFKGLGSSTPIEVQKYFQNIKRYSFSLKYTDDDNELFSRAFGRKKFAERKRMIEEYLEERDRTGHEKYLYEEGHTREVTISDYINLELVPFWYETVKRSIACLIDGLKPSQRKIIYTLFQRSSKEEEKMIKVAQLGGLTAETCSYIHSEQGLCDVIIKLAQDFPGSNNINLLEPIGQFGSLICGGNDSASPRYIFTRIAKLTRLIFRPEDNPLLEFKCIGNKKLEPNFYLPTIPLILINGCDGIASGFSTVIPKHDPRQIIHILRRMLRGEVLTAIELNILPWYKNCNVKVVQTINNRHYTKGTMRIIDDKIIEINNLPMGTRVETYKKNVLQHLCNIGILKCYKEQHSSKKIKFLCEFMDGQLDKVQEEGGELEEIFQLSTTLKHGKMYAFNGKYRLKQFESIIQILKEFYSDRLQFYGKRKAYLESQLRATVSKLANKVRYITAVNTDQLSFKNKQSIQEYIDYVMENGYAPDPIKKWQETEESVNDFDYIIGMPTYMMNEEVKKDLLRQIDTKKSELAALLLKTPEILWLQDLKELEEAMNNVEGESSGTNGVNTTGGLGLSTIPRGGKKKTIERMENDFEGESSGTNDVNTTGGLGLSTIPRGGKKKTIERMENDFEGESSGTNDVNTTGGLGLSTIPRGGKKKTIERMENDFEGESSGTNDVNTTGGLGLSTIPRGGKKKVSTKTIENMKSFNILIDKMHADRMAEIYKIFPESKGTKNERPTPSCDSSPTEGKRKRFNPEGESSGTNGVNTTGGLGLSTIPRRGKKKVSTKTIENMKSFNILIDKMHADRMAEIYKIFPESKGTKNERPTPSCDSSDI